jgi:hypothetical protein
MGFPSHVCIVFSPVFFHFLPILWAFVNTGSILEAFNSVSNTRFFLSPFCFCIIMKQVLQRRRKDHPVPFRRSLSYDTSFDPFDIADVANSSVFRFTDALSSEDDSPSFATPIRRKEIKSTKREEPLKSDSEAKLSGRRKHKDLGPTLRFISKESLLDSTITGSSFRGFVNLMIMMLVR